MMRNHIALISGTILGVTAGFIIGFLVGFGDKSHEASYDAGLLEGFEQGRIQGTDDIWSRLNWKCRDKFSYDEMKKLDKSRLRPLCIKEVGEIMTRERKKKKVVGIEVGPLGAFTNNYTKAEQIIYTQGYKDGMDDYNDD